MAGAQPRPQIEQLVQSCLQACGAQIGLRRVVVGFSGGADSTALLVATARVVATHFSDVQLLAVHVNHGLQAAADTWQEHCVAVCTQLDVTLEVAAVEVSERGNVEANARTQRYAVFARCSTPGTLLLLGHHQHDQTETILYRLFQGRGVLPMRSDGQLGDGQFARPLLAVPPADLRVYLEHQGVSWIEDLSNQDVRLARNFLRQEVVPLLDRHWQQLHQALARVGGAQVAVQAALEHELARSKDRVPLTQLPRGPAAVAWLRAFLNTRGVFSVADKALAVFVEQLDDDRQATLDCGEERSLRSYDGHLHFVPAVANDDAIAANIAVGQQRELAGGTLSLQLVSQPGRQVICCTGPLRIAYRRGGERIQMAGFSKSLKQLFAQARVPTWQRATYPLLYLGEELVCVPNLAVAASHQSPAMGEGGSMCVAVWQPH